MALSASQQEFRQSSEFADIAARVKAEVRGSAYRFTTRPESVHFEHNLEVSWGERYCCHTCSVLGVRY